MFFSRLSDGRLLLFLRGRAVSCFNASERSSVDESASRRSLSPKFSLAIIQALFPGFKIRRRRSATLIE
jgi:hypothetical protein